MKIDFSKSAARSSVRRKMVEMLATTKASYPTYENNLRTLDLERSVQK